MGIDGGNEHYAEYVSAVEALEALGGSVCTLIRALLLADDVRVHSVSYRVKTMQSADGKIARKAERYGAYSDLLDLLGIRVITYFPDDVDAVSAIVDREFEVDYENSVDKRETLEPTVFGYLSAHYVVKFKDNRTTLPEYRPWVGVRFEVQVRSILQHAWAEIEHDLGYKSEQALPRSFRRRFSRLAGLLELADAEFLSIRDDLASYQGSIGERLDANPGEIGLNQTSLRAWLDRSELVRGIDKQLSELAGATLTEPSDQRLARDVEFLALVGIKTLGELAEALTHYGTFIPLFFELWWKRGEEESPPVAEVHKTLPRGISFFYLAYVLVAQRSETEIGEYLRRRNIRSEGGVEDVIAEILETWREVTERIGEPGGPSEAAQ